MKIGFLGNPNNYPFMVARTLKAAGHDVRFIVDSRQMLHRPEAMCAEYRDGYPDWIVDCSRSLPNTRKSVQIEHLFTLSDASFRTSVHRRIVDLLASCDSVVVSAHGPAYLPDVGRPAFAMIVGYDLESLANPEAAEKIRRTSLDWKYPYRFAVSSLLKRLADRQRAGLQSVKAASYFLPGLVPKGDALLQALGIEGDRREFLMMADTDRIAPAPPPQNAIPRLFVGARHVWHKPLPPTMSALDDKGIDKIVSGVALYLRSGGAPVELVMVRKGQHAPETARLAEREGITSSTVWLDEMTHAEIVDEYRKADIVFDQIGPGFFGMVALDAMACARPVISNGRPEVLEPVLGAPSPLCEARTAEEVAEQLHRLVPNAQLREDVGKASRAYIERYFSAKRAAEIILRRLGNGH